MFPLNIFNFFKSKRNEPEILQINKSFNQLRLSDLVKVTNDSNQMNNLSLRLKKINIQNLSRKNQTEVRIIYKNDKIIKINDNITLNKLQKNPKEIYYYEDTSMDKNKNIYIGANDFLGSFLSAYNLHGDIMLVPDDIWIQISLFFSKYINSKDNAEKLRNKLVRHQDKIDLVVIEKASSISESLEMEYEWDYFFSEIIKQIESNTLDGIVKGFQSDFTTTTDLYKIISTAIIMDSFKQYFNYGRIICMCGINNIYFAGIKEDWEKILNKLEFLSNFDSGNNILIEYISKIKIIINKFIDTFDNNVDISFWNSIMTTNEVKRKSSGGPYTITWIDGWILHFFGIYEKTDIDNIPSYTISVPIKLINQFTQTEKNLILGGGWVGISKIDEYVYKPDLGLSIINKELFDSEKNNEERY
jgi:hypothetical protein